MILQITYYYKLSQIYQVVIVSASKCGKRQFPLYSLIKLLVFWDDALEITRR